MLDATSNCLALVPYNPTSLTVSNVSVAAERAKLVQAAISIHLRGREYRLALGFVLHTLHTLLARPGVGSFMNCVKSEIRMPYNTARDYMREYREWAGYNEIRYEDEPADLASVLAITDADPNDGTPDSFELAMAQARQLVANAQRKTADKDRPRDFNWKFPHLPAELAEKLRAAKKLLDPIYAAQLLLDAAAALQSYPALTAGNTLKAGE
jgi:hypothetical protein